MKQLHIFFSGRVQGVGFRYTTATVAKQLGLSGWVKNLADGRVEVLIIGPEKTLKEFLLRIDEHFSGYITEKKQSWDEVISPQVDFQIRY